MSQMIAVMPANERVPKYQNLYNELIPCGFPSPSEGWEDAPLDLHDYCVKRPASTFFIPGADSDEPGFSGDQSGPGHAGNIWCGNVQYPGSSSCIFIVM